MIVRSLYAKLALALVGLFILTGCLLAALMLYANDLYHQELYQKLNRDLAEHIVAHDDLLIDGEPDRVRIKALFETMMSLNPSVEIYLLDPSGGILAYSAPPGKVTRERVDTGPIERFLAGERLPLVGDDPRHPGRQKIFSAAPISTDDGRQGYLYVIFPGEQYESAAAKLQGSYIRDLSLWGLAAATAFALSAALVVFALLTRRLRRLTDEVGQLHLDGVRRPREGQRGAHPGGDEIERLAFTFDQMAGQMAEQLDDQKEIDRLRRELVANVSHDLRTPLASLQGYLETLLLKGETLGEAERAKYLRIAAKHSERLGKLVSELFELAKLDSTVTMPEREPFSLAELVQDVVQKFELRAREAGIRLDTRLDGDLPFVNGNIAQIERVLENMIDNALRHTSTGGKVDVALLPGEHDVTVRLSDTGSGIPEGDLPHIFDRFYRPRGQLGKNDHGAGLGLAIARRIVELHGRRIRAESVLRSGTTISFDLPYDGDERHAGPLGSHPPRREAS